MAGTRRKGPQRLPPPNAAHRCRKPRFRRLSNNLNSVLAIWESPCRDTKQDGGQAGGTVNGTFFEMLGFTVTFSLRTSQRRKVTRDVEVLGAIFGDRFSAVRNLVSSGW